MMRRSSTRRTGVLTSTATASTDSGNKAALRELEKIDAFFSQYVEKFDETSIGPDGIEALCEDLAVPRTDIRDEWRKGMKAMRVDSVDKLKKALLGLQQDV
ncbi:unnamed protein product [Sphagnum balticum]